MFGAEVRDLKRSLSLPMDHGIRHALVALLLLAVLCGAVSPAPGQGWVQMTAPGNSIGPIACSADGSNLVLAGGAWAGGTWYGEGGLVFVSHDSGATWMAGDVPVALWDAVASSADGTALMAATFDGALYTSKDSGTTWRPNDLTNVWGAVACSADGTKLFAEGAGTTNGSHGAIYASNDSGVTWAPTGAPSAEWDQLACSADGTTLLAGEGANVWVSTNSGASFRLACILVPPYLATGDSASCASLACSAGGTTMMAGVADGGYYYFGVATSVDSGATWTWSPSLMPSNGVFCSRWLTVCCSAEGSRMATVGYSTVAPIGGLPLCRVFLSSDSGASWTEAPPLLTCTGLAISADGCALFGVSMGGMEPSFSGGVAVLRAEPAPSLAVARSPGGLVLSWIVPSMNSALQQSPDLATTNWTNMPNAPVLDYSTLKNRVAVPAPAGTMFYRLTSQ